MKILATLVKALEERLAASRADASEKKHLPDPVSLPAERPLRLSRREYEADLSG